MKKIISLFFVLLLCSGLYATELSDIFGNYPKENKYNVSKMEKDTFLISCDTITGQWGKDTINLLNNYAPKYAVAYASRQNFIDNENILTLLRENNINFFGYDWGITPDFCNYLKERDALDYTWGGLNMNKDVIDACSHCHSTSAKAANDIWKTYLESTVNCGGLGVIHCDLISPCFYGRGVCGYNPVALNDYILDLKGTDEGFVANIKGIKKKYHFSDYVKFYLGYMPKPMDFGFKSWDDYKPVLKKDYDPEGFEKYIIDGKQSRVFYFNVDESTKRDYINNFLLHDMLCHYEMIKFCYRMGTYAKSVGGDYFTLPNPEDMSNGIDDYFLSSLCNVGGETSEYFQSPCFLNRSYSLNNYMRENSHNAGQMFGGVLEVGGGGNDIPYYKNEISYLVAYELRANCNLDYLQGDHWTRSYDNFSVENVRNDKGLSFRCACLLAYANGYKYAIKDNYKKLNSAFTSVISRRIFRPWGRDWRTYSFYFDDPNGNFLPEEVYFKNGYLFDTVGFEENNLKGKLVSWAVNKSPYKKFENYMNRIKNGTIENGILIGEALDYLIDTDMNIVPLTKYYPDLETQLLTKPIKIRDLGSNWEETVKYEPNKNINNLSCIKIKLEDKEYSVYGNIYSIKGDTVLGYNSVPILKKIKYGKGNIYVMTFNPAIKENYELASFVTDYIMKNVNIKPVSENIDGSSLTLYKNKDSYMVRLMNKSIDGDNWGDFYSKSDVLQRNCAYETENHTEGYVYLKPDRNYYVYDYFGEMKVIKSDNQGALKLNSDKTFSVFIIKEYEDKNLENELKNRKTEFENLLKFKL